MFGHSQRKIVAPAVVETHSRLKYPHRLSFYEAPPLANVTLEEFETWAVDRLRVLAEIEASFIRNHSFDSLTTVVHAQSAKYLASHSNQNAAEYDLDVERRKDHVSHFILRLAFCRSEDLRQRFIKTETALFRVRFADENKTDLANFIASMKSAGTPISPEDKMMYKTQLMGASPSLRTDQDFEKETFYKVQWTKVADLVAQRRVFIKGGFAYVPSILQSSIIFQEFQSRLTNALEVTARALPRLDEDDRLLPIINHLSQGFLAGVAGEFADGFGADLGADAVKKEMIDEMSRKHFPLCMRSIHENLKRDRHLKHQGRLQYTLFLKVLGLPIDEALAFWRESYGQSMSDDKFNKEYKYNIRHSYGLEGKRANYPARNCQSIITQNQPGPTENHGCPFRHFSTTNLQTALNSYYGISTQSQDMADILNAVKSQHYHVACTRVFELSHPTVPAGEGVGDGESVSHPNKYAARSRELEQERKDELERLAQSVAGEAKPEQAAIPPASEPAPMEVDG